MTTLQEAAMRKALEALEAPTPGAITGSAESWSIWYDKRFIAMEALRTALAQQGGPTDAQLDVVFEKHFPNMEPTHEYFRAMFREVIALAQQREQQLVCHGCGIPAGDVHMSTCKSGKWPSRVSNGDTATPAPQAQEPARNVTKEEDAILRGALLRSGTVIHPKPAPQPASELVANFIVSAVVIKDTRTGFNTQNKLYPVSAANSDEATGKALPLVTNDFPEHRLHTMCFIQTAPAPQAQDWKKEPEYVPPLVKWEQEQPAPKGEPVMFAWKRNDGTYHDASGTEHSCGMHPLFAHAEPAPRPAQDVEAYMVNLPEPVAWFANYGGNVYTEAQLKQAVRDALDK